MTRPPDSATLAASMEEYALYLKAMLPLEQQAIIDAIVEAAAVRQNRYPSRILVARLRGAAMSHRDKSPVITAHMELLANQLERETNVRKHN